MASLLPIFFDVVNKRLIKSATSSDQFLIGSLYQQDIYSIEFQAFKPTGLAFGTTYSQVNLSAFSLQISIGSAGVINASANTWTPSADGTKLTGVLDLNTTNVDAL